MRILIIGGGVVGVTRAYQLLRDGREVVLLERLDAVVRETSWGQCRHDRAGSFLRVVLAARSGSC